MNDYFYIQFSAAEQTGQMLIQDAQSLAQLLQHLQSTLSNLYASGLQGAFLDTLQARADYIFNTLRYFCDKSDESGQELVMIVRIMRELDAECARQFAENQSTGAVISSIGLTNDEFGNGWDKNQPYRTSYHLGNAAWDAADFVSNLWSSRKMGAGDVAADYILKKLGLNVGKNVLPIFGGVVSGIMDYQLEYGDGPFNSAAFATEVSSGILQGAVGATGVGGVIMLSNTAVQLGGHILTYSVHQNADALAGGDPILANAYRRQANDLNQALDTGNLDNAFDAVTGNIVDIITSNGSVEQNLGEMVLGVGKTLSGVAQIGFEFQTMKTVMEIGSAKQTANILMDSLHADEGFQQIFNQSVDMAMQDIQNLNIAELSSFQHVAEQRIDYFVNVFGI